MSTEIERQFRHFDYDTIMNFVKTLKIKHTGTYLYRVVSFESHEKNLFIRVRNEILLHSAKNSAKITFTIKQKSSNNTLYDKEWEVDVSNFETIIEMLKKLGLRRKYLYEKIRDKYSFPSSIATDTNLIFDYYPALPPYIEIESNTVENLEKAIRTLQLDEKESRKYSVKELYNEYYSITKNRPELDLEFSTANQIFDMYILDHRQDFMERLNKQRKMLKNTSKKSKKSVQSKKE
jgi:adenylate cyclase class IV